MGCAIGMSWREALLRGFLIFGAALVIGTEVLGSMGALTAWCVFAFWCLVSIVAGWLAFRRRKSMPLAVGPVGVVEGIALAGITGILVVTAITALASPPNSADAMAYHMPRVVHWAQQHSVAFFPTHYLNQIMLQPFAEYFMLHTYLLAGDRFANLGQWLGSVVSIAGVSLIARNLGAGRRGQVLTGLFCATLPNGILQSSGAKNDYLLAAFLVCFVYFVQRELAAYAGCALALALMTKATAYVFAPAVAIAILSLTYRNWRKLALFASACAAAILVLNGPQYWRNYALSGSPVGYDSAQGDGQFRWRNERFGWRETASNLLRNASEQLGARSERWNREVYDAVMAAHRSIGIDANDPATTWPGARVEAPVNANHEANAPNRWHLILLIACAVVLARRRPRLAPLLYLAGLAAGFGLFCFYLKWQPFLARMFLPLFVLASPIAGLAIERVRFAPLHAILCLFLLNNARPALFENWVRPLSGAHSVFRVPRVEQYFADLGQFHNQDDMAASARLVGASGCSAVGVDTSQFQVEYPFLAIVLQTNPNAHFIHTGVTNPSARFYSAREPKPCAVVCMNCAGMPQKLSEYAGVGDPVVFGRFVVFSKKYPTPTLQ